ncbi:MAG: type III polyketide synthase [Bacteriovoracaceae bacterium]|nr:type III polyketide synthase [Bacteriovoracaceae bacterium]
MTKIIQATTVFPENVYSQNQIYDFIATLWPKQSKKLLSFFENVQVKERHLVLPIEKYTELATLVQRNQLWQEHGSKLAKKAVLELFEKTGLNGSEIDYLVTTSVTGFSIPSLDTILMNELNISTNAKRLPLFGFGCLGGCAGINRAHDFLKANPKKAAILVGLELCSLTFQLRDVSVANFVGTSLFGDGAAAVLLVGDEHPLAKTAGFEVVDYQAFFYPKTETTMGWNILETGFQIVLSGDVAQLVENEVPKNSQHILDLNKLSSRDVKFVVSHPGGPKVLKALASSLGLTDEHFQHSWQSLAANGNMSSVSVLNVLERSLTRPLGQKGEMGFLMAMGPGFNSEITLLKQLK